jgi:AmiR/NasT family two-component response regulator
MNSRYDKLIENYGITDPKPVIEKLEKADARFQEVVDRSLKELKEKIAYKKQKAKAEKILNKKKK